VVLSEALAQVVELATKPVSDASPAGVWVRYEPEFETLKAEIDKLSRGSAADVDWTQVRTLSTEILQNKSKDILVASYLCLGLFQSDGYPGLGEGLSAVRQLLTTFWDNLYPEKKRMKARVSALEWLAERLEHSFAQQEAKLSDQEAVKKCQSNIGEIDGFLDETLGGDAPNLRKLQRALEEQEKEAEPTPPPAPSPAAPAAARTSAPAPRPAAAPEIDISTLQGLTQATNQALTGLQRLAGHIRAQNPASATSYKFARVASWSPIDSLPPNTDGKTMVPGDGVSSQRLESLKSMLASANWPALLEEAEGQFPSALFWFDLQRFVASALEGLGPAYDGARQVLTAEFGDLLRRFPGLLDLRFGNEIPFADDETKAWVGEEILAASAAGDQAAGSSGPGRVQDVEDGELQDVQGKAAELAKKRKIGEAVSLYLELVNRSAVPRQRFLRRFHLARLLEKTRQHRLALAQLEVLDDEIRRYELEQWEPGLTVDVLQLMLECQKQMVKKEWKSVPEAVQKVQDLFTRLARLDVGVALKVQV
jgi:type VI secretion system protein VasJ